jgi:ferrous iron transport protein B
MKHIALLVNPNYRKTTVFNLLTGARQKVGNWPGVTVDKKTGHFSLGDKQFELIDLPGIYSLKLVYQGLDKKIAKDFIEQDDADLVINLVDATNLERSLVLTQQLAEQDIPYIIGLNRLDVAKQQGLSIHPEKLQQQLDVPVISMTASKREGLEELKAALTAVQSEPSQRSSKPLALEIPVTEDPILQRYHRSLQLSNGVVEVSLTHDSPSERIDNAVLNKWLEVPFFLLMIYLMFTFAVNLGAVFVDFFDILGGRAS